MEGLGGSLRMAQCYLVRTKPTTSGTKEDTRVQLMKAEEQAELRTAQAIGSAWNNGRTEVQIRGLMARVLRWRCHQPGSGSAGREQDLVGLTTLYRPSRERVQTA
jgi:hypothetical protein